MLNNNEKLEARMAEEGYTDLRWIDGRLCGVRRFIFTTGVCLDLDFTGYRGRFCFDTYADARHFLADWDGVTPAEVGVDGCAAIK